MAVAIEEITTPRRQIKALPALEDDPLWYKDAVIYQLHVRAFADSNADGIGDFTGLTGKLDYLQDLGVTALWLLPFYPSPLKDDGYDIAQYNSIHPSYGSLRDFKTFVREAHRRGLRVITELVVNHTSDKHAWFQRARTARPGTRTRDFYVWSDTIDKYREARIIFKDFETSNWSWDPVAKAHFWHRFYHHQPDLNFDNPAVHKTLFDVLDFWMEIGVDGVRLDAVPYLYEREGTTCENLPETHGFLRKLRKHVDQSFRNRMLLAEANQWPEDTRPYFGEGDECQMAFHFPLMPRLFISVAMEDRFPIVDIMQQTPDIPAQAQWALFLRNHDELTLEMVTDEDRDYMYRMYAQDTQARINLGIRRRLAPLLGNHRRKIELLNGLLFSFPGTPVVYYGDEIGMGDNIYLGDRNGVRTPMQWSSDRNAGFSRANPQKLFLPTIIDPEYHYEAINVEAQQGNPHSLLWWMKRLIALRKRYQAFGRGTLEFLHPENRKVLAFTRNFDHELILVVANLSRFVQCVELDLSKYRGATPLEMFGHTELPRISDQPYFLTLAPHNFFWLLIQPPQTAEGAPSSTPTRGVAVINASSWDDLFRARNAKPLSEALIRYMKGRRWFAGKAGHIKGAELVDLVELPGTESGIGFVKVEYRDSEAETYVLPLAISGRRQSDQDAQNSESIIAMIRTGSETRPLYEAIGDRDFSRALLELAGRRRVLKGRLGELRGVSNRIYKEARSQAISLEPSISRADQSNTSILFGDRLFLKLFRKLEGGLNTDLEVSRFLTEKTSFRNIPPIAGSLEYRHNRTYSSLAILQQFVPNGGDAWKLTLDHLGSFFERVLSQPAAFEELRNTLPRGSLLELAAVEPPRLAVDLIGTYISSVELLGCRTAEMHTALASRDDDPAFAPEPFTPHYQRSIYQHMRTNATRALQLLRRRLRDLQQVERQEAEQLLGREDELMARFRTVLDQKITGLRIRLHGDYHLGQVLYTGRDFMITDFEGEPGRPLSERRIKRSALRDVAGMLRSFHYAPYAVIFGQASGTVVRAEDLGSMEVAARYWHRWTSAIFLRDYLECSRGQLYLPKTSEQLRVLLHAFLLEKACYEIAYELQNRPKWVSIPLRGVLQLLEEAEKP